VPPLTAAGPIRHLERAQKAAERSDRSRRRGGNEAAGVSPYSLLGGPALNASFIPQMLRCFP
jgi:hypothetical protein